MYAAKYEDRTNPGICCISRWSRIADSIGAKMVIEIESGSVSICFLTLSTSVGSINLGISSEKCFERMFLTNVSRSNLPKSLNRSEKDRMCKRVLKCCIEVVWLIDARYFSKYLALMPIGSSSSCERWRYEPDVVEEVDPVVLVDERLELLN